MTPVEMNSRQMYLFLKRTGYMPRTPWQKKGFDIKPAERNRPVAQIKRGPNIIKVYSREQVEQVSNDCKPAEWSIAKEEPKRLGPGVSL